MRKYELGRVCGLAHVRTRKILAAERPGNQGRAK